MSWKPEVKVDGQWSQNALVFATEAEAEANARDLMFRWFAVTDSRATESDLPPNYRYVDGQLVAIDPQELFRNAALVLRVNPDQSATLTHLPTGEQLAIPAWENLQAVVQVCQETDIEYAAGVLTELRPNYEETAP